MVFGSTIVILPHQQVNASETKEEAEIKASARIMRVTYHAYSPLRKQGESSDRKTLLFIGHYARLFFFKTKLSLFTLWGIDFFPRVFSVLPNEFIISRVDSFFLGGTGSNFRPTN